MSTLRPTDSRIPAPLVASTQVKKRHARRHKDRLPPNQGTPAKPTADTGNSQFRTGFSKSPDADLPVRRKTRRPTPSQTPAPSARESRELLDTELRRQKELLEKLGVRELDTEVKKRLDFREVEADKLQQERDQIRKEREQLEADKREAEERLRTYKRQLEVDRVTENIVRGAAGHAHRQTRHLDRAGKSLVFAHPDSTPPAKSRPRSEFQPTPVPVSTPVDLDEPDVEEPPDAPSLQPPPRQTDLMNQATQTAQASTGDVGSQTEPVSKAFDQATQTAQASTGDVGSQAEPVPDLNDLLAQTAARRNYEAQQARTQAGFDQIFSTARDLRAEYPWLSVGVPPHSILPSSNQRPDVTQTQVQATTETDTQTAPIATTTQTTQTSAIAGMNALASASRAAQGASPETLVSLLEELQRNPQLRQLASAGLLSWGDLLSDKHETLPDGTKVRVVDAKKLLALQQRLSTLAQKEDGKLQNIQQVAVQSRTVPGLKQATPGAIYPGVSVFMYPREMPAGRPGA